LFLEEIQRVSKVFKPIVKEKNVKILSQFDADGISSASIIVKMLIRMNATFELKIYKQLTKEIIEKLEIDENDFLILTDFGSGQLDNFKKILEKTQILILDHHEFKNMEHINLFHLNPLLFGEDEASSSIISYIFAKATNLKNVDLIDLAIVGAIGDEQEDRGELKGLARKILEEAVTLGKVTVMKGLRFYGRNTRPIHKVLEYSFDPFIPNISGSESNAIQFLSELGISVKDEGEWKKLKDLTIEEQQKLASAIIFERLKSNQSYAEDIFGENYSLLGIPEEFQDAREFSTLLNACGRLGRPDLGVRLSLGDFNPINEVWTLLDEYRKTISDCMNLLRENDNIITKTPTSSFLFCEGKISESLIGTITSIALNSNLFDQSRPIFGFAKTDDDRIKVSARTSKNIKEINLRDIILYAAKVVEGEGGGHKHAAGAFIPKDKRQEFVTIIESKLSEIYGNQEN
jgi:RecJ-like exonuclease